jgi:hypothetical protein
MLLKKAFRELRPENTGSGHFITTPAALVKKGLESTLESNWKALGKPLESLVKAPCKLCSQDNFKIYLLTSTQHIPVWAI